VINVIKEINYLTALKNTDRKFSTDFLIALCVFEVCPKWQWWHCKSFNQNFSTSCWMELVHYNANRLYHYIMLQLFNRCWWANKQFSWSLCLVTCIWHNMLWPGRK